METVSLVQHVQSTCERYGRIQHSTHQCVLPCFATQSLRCVHDTDPRVSMNPLIQKLMFLCFPYLRTRHPRTSTRSPEHQHVAPQNDVNRDVCRQAQLFCGKSLSQEILEEASQQVWKAANCDAALSREDIRKPGFSSRVPATVRT